MLGSRDTLSVSGGRRLRKRSAKKENMAISYHLEEGGRGWGLEDVSRVPGVSGRRLRWLSGRKEKYIYNYLKDRSLVFI